MDEMMEEIEKVIHNSKFFKNFKNKLEASICVVLVLIGVSTAVSNIERAKHLDKYSKPVIKKQGPIVPHFTSQRDPNVDMLIACARAKPQKMEKVARIDLKQKTRDNYALR
ncbi:hypothetical protein KO317_00140 [Candidatus Micrarchaeota archaeon]|jgi:hypothetical protein|nr:hypothetical protein [Candidatus Micrarchaeota archaeon]